MDDRANYRHLSNVYSNFQTIKWAKMQLKFNIRITKFSQLHIFSEQIKILQPQ